MMNGRLITVLVFALVVASAASFAVYHFLASGIKQQPTISTQSKMLVANRDLAVGSLIKDGDLREIAWTGALPAQSINASAEVVGRGVIATIYKDEPIFSQRLAGKGAGAGLASIIPLGKRAVALRINDVVGLAGFVQPGMRVDVLIAGTGPGGGTQAGVLSRTILQNIEVLSSGQKFEKNMEGKPEEAQVVNLLVSPDQAEILSLAGSETKVQLVLRNPMDTEELPTKGTSISRLFGGTAGAAESPAPHTLTEPARPHIVSRRIDPTPAPSAAQPASPRKPDADTIEVFTGNKKSEQQVAPSGEVKGR
jgi:pilus assembly protein CpaB